MPLTKASARDPREDGVSPGPRRQASRLRSLWRSFSERTMISLITLCGLSAIVFVFGIFYFIWNGQHGTVGPFDITKILAAGPRQPQWGPEGVFHHWGEPELGYYLPDDTYVIRRHCEMLVDAGVGVIFLDVTNGFVYQPVYEKLFAVYREIRNEGSRTPEIGFLLNSGA